MSRSRKPCPIQYDNGVFEPKDFDISTDPGWLELLLLKDMRAGRTVTIVNAARALSHKDKVKQMVEGLGIKNWRVIGGNFEYLDDIDDGCTGFWWSLPMDEALKAFDSLEDGPDYTDWCELTENAEQVAA